MCYLLFVCSSVCWFYLYLLLIIWTYETHLNCTEYAIKDEIGRKAEWGKRNYGKWYWGRYFWNTQCFQFHFESECFEREIFMWDSCFSIILPIDYSLFDGLGPYHCCYEFRWSEGIIAKADIDEAWLHENSMMKMFFKDSSSCIEQSMAADYRVYAVWKTILFLISIFNLTKTYLRSKICLFQSTSAAKFL